MKTKFILVGLLLLFMACGTQESEQESATLTSAVAPSDQAPPPPAENQPAIEPHQEWDGFYFYDIYMGSVIVIHQGKYYNFARKDSKSFYKDFEYDIGFELNPERLIPITRKYYLDRNDELQSKETVLFDTQPILKGDQTVAVQCRGYRHEALSSFGVYLDAISTTREAVVADLKANSEHSDDQAIEAALDDPDFVSKSNLTAAPLRGQELAFWQLLANIIEAN